jgi:putative RecB family exonuclease
MNNLTEFTIDDIFGDSLNLKLDEAEIIVEEEVVNQTAKLIKVTPQGVKILDEELMNKVKKKNLSASMISSFTQCPADWLMDSFILPMLDHEEPVHFLRGHLFHETMEAFFALPKEERTPKKLSQTAMQVIKQKYPESLNDFDTMQWVKDALKGYLDTGFAYKDVDVAMIPKKAGGPPELGVEIFVKGRLGNTQREVVGFVDRVDRLPDGTLDVVDYKTGKKIHPYSPELPVSDHNSFDYWRQQISYTMLLEQAGHKVSGARLEFPIAKGVVVVDTFNEKLRKQVEEDFERVDASLTKCIEENLFPFHGHKFCKWCGMLNPSYPMSRYGKLNVSWEDLNQYVEFLD